MVVDGIGFGEGPVWCPAGSVPERSGGTLVVTSVSHGALFRVWPEAGRKEQLADTGGGANGAALASDGGFLVTQNGGPGEDQPAGDGVEPPPGRVAGAEHLPPVGQDPLLDGDIGHGREPSWRVPEGVRGLCGEISRSRGVGLDGTQRTLSPKRPSN